MPPEQIDVAMMLLILGGVLVSLFTTRKRLVLYMSGLNIAWAAFAYSIGYPLIAFACFCAIVSNAVIFFRERAKGNSV